MKARTLIFTAVGMVAGFTVTQALMANSPEEVEAKSIHEFTMKDIEGKDVPLKKYQGKVLLVVNVASKCGLTPQYEGLQKLYNENKDKGLVILGFPANEFNGQEPGSNQEIKEFCSRNYGVTFPMFSKIAVKGEGTHPLYKWLVSQSDRPKDEIEWNFAKFLVDRNGKVVKRFSPRTTPTAAELTEAVKAALAAK